jgi:hypothetical protein
MFTKYEFNTILPYTYTNNSNSYNNESTLIERFFSTIYSNIIDRHNTNDPDPVSEPEYLAIWIDSSNNYDKIAFIL